MRIGWIARTLLACAAAWLSAGSGHASMERDVTFEDLQRLNPPDRNYIATLDVSSQLRRLAIAGENGVILLDAATGRVLQQLGEGQLPRWSPDGRKLAFYSTRSGSLQLWLWDASDARLSQLTRFPDGVDPDPMTRMAGYLIDAFDYDWSPDGTAIVLASRERVDDPAKVKGSPLVLDVASPPDLTLRGVFAHPSVWTAGEAYSPDARQLQFRAPSPNRKLHSRLYRIDVEDGKSQPVETGAGEPFHPRWSPDGRSILYARIPSGAAVLAARQGSIAILDLASGRIREADAGFSLRFKPRWSRDGRRIAFLEGTFDAIPTLVTLDLHSGAATRTKLEKPVLKYEWQGPDGSLILSYSDTGGSSLGRFNPKNGSLNPEVANVQIGWSVTPSGSLYWLAGAVGPAVQWSSRAGAPAQRIGELESPRGLEGLRLGRSEPIDYRNSKGVALRGTLLYPPDYKPGERYPLIVDAYPFSSWSDWSNPMGGNYAWAAEGYLVFRPYARSPNAIANCSGSRSFCEVARGPAGWETATDDVMSGVDALVARGLVDPARMCLWGHSNGGGLVANIVARTSRFRCAVVVSPALPDWVGAPLLASDAWKLLSEWAGTTPVDDPAAFLGLSAIFRARHVTTPLLIAAGDDDGLFLLGAISLYNAVRFAGGQVCLLRYPDQGHVFTGSSLQDFWIRQMAFFHAHLGDRDSASASENCDAVHREPTGSAHVGDR